MNVPSDEIKYIKSQEHEAEEQILSQAIEKEGIAFLSESKMTDMLATIVHSKIRNSYNQSKPNQMKLISSSFSFIAFLGVILNIVFIIYMVSFLCTTPFFKNIIAKFSGSSFGQNNVVCVGNFVFQPACNLVDDEYFGQESIFENWMESSKTLISDINSRVPKKVLDKESAYTRLNYALFGPPGTGKTFFVQNLAKKLDFHLKEQYLKFYKTEEFEIAKSEIKKKFCDENKRKLALKKFIDSQESRLLFCFVTPANINDKYVGQSEQNIKDLFKNARDLAQGAFRATILFFDEGDVFFSKRSSSSESSSAEAAINVKTQLLQNIGVNTPEEYVPMFVFTASNRKIEFDPAFSRRFSNKEEFKPFTYEERVNFYKFILSDYSIEDREISLLAEASQNKTQAFIYENIQKYIKRNRAISTNKFLFTDFLIFLNNNLSS